MKNEQMIKGKLILLLSILLGLCVLVAYATIPNPGHSANQIGSGTFSGTSSDVWSFPGKVGIGTTNPLTGLMVEEDNGNGWSSWFRASSSSSGVVLGTKTKGAIQGMTSAGAADNLVLNPLGGYVGVGTTTPGMELDVVATPAVGVGNTVIRSTNNQGTGAASAVNAMTVNSGSATGVWADLAGYDGTYWFGVRGNSGTATSPAVMGVNTATNGLAGYFSGNVGIGTAVPANQLSLGASNDAIMSYMLTGIHATIPTSRIQAHYNTVSWADNLLNFQFYDGSTFQSRVTFTSNGSVGIGTTSPNEKLVVNGNIKFGDTIYNAYTWSPTSSNLVPDPYFGNLSQWSGLSGNSLQSVVLPTGEYVQSLVITTTGNVQVVSNYIPVSPQKTYRVSLWIMSNYATIGTRYLGFNCYDSTKTQVNCYNSAGTGSTNYYFWYSSLTANTFFKKVGYLFGNNTPNSWTNPGDTSSTNYRLGSNVAYIQVRFLNYYNYNNASVSNWFALPTVEEVQSTNREWAVKDNGDIISLASGSVGIGTASPAYRLDVKGSGTISAVVFTGTGLNDATSGGTYTGTNSTAVNYTVIIDGSGVPDTFKWQKTGGAFTNGVAITGAAQTLTDGVQITFANTTGHTLNDQWVITATPINPLAIQNTAGTRSLYVGNDGLVGVGTTNPKGRFDTLALASAVNMTLGTATQPGLSVTSYDGGQYGMYFGVYSSTGNSWIQAGRTDTPTAYSMSLQAAGGNVGIGVTSPSYTLDVNGNTRIGGNALVAGNSNELWTQPLTNSTVGLWINYRGYADSTTQFRDFYVGNGKATAIAFFQGSSGYVGIGTGTGSPPQMLTVAGTGNVSGALYLGNSKCASGYVLTADPSTGLVSCTAGGTGAVGGSGTAGYISMWNASTTQNNSVIYQNGSGIGIGTTAVGSYNLYISGTTKASGAIDTDAQFLGQPADTVSTPSFTWTGDATTGMWRPATSTIAFSNAGNETMRIDSSGRVGIGTTSPVSKLSVSGGDLQVESGMGRFKGWYNAGSGLALETGISGGQGYVIAYDRTASTYAKLNLGTSVTIDTAGNVGIGTGNPQAKLDVNGNIAAYNEINEITTNANAALFLNYRGYLGGTTQFRDLWIGNGKNANVMFVQGSSGNVGIGTTSPGAALEVNGGVRLNTATSQPSCTSALRGTFWVVQSASGTADYVYVCLKTSSDTYNWVMMARGN